LNKTWITKADNAVVLTLRIVPRSSRNEICGEHGDALKIKLQAPPVEGKANKALIEFLAETLGIHRNNISILSGDTGRNKRVAITGISSQEITEKLLPADDVD
jgi:uncharacterized protein (TIGR00251 family)